MTTMLPDRIPSDAPAAEAALFGLIRDAPHTNAYVCLHSVGISRHRRKEYAEADFIIVGPAGVFCLEVKGGHVERHAGTWTIGWPNGRKYESKEGPFMQAQGVRWALLDYLKKRLGQTEVKQFLIGWGVAFPDIVFDRVDPEWDQQVIYDQRDKASSFLLYIHRLQAYFHSRSQEIGRESLPELSPYLIGKIVDSLKGDFEIATSIRGLLLESRRELVKLSPAQYSVLDFALNESNPRILCDGAAGTGKTLIALEAAKRLSATGLKVLLLCFNDNLSRFLAADIQSFGENVNVSTLHGFLGSVIRKGGFAAQLESARSQQGEATLFGETYPALFESAASSLIEEGALTLFDVIIIDEAQDILSGPLMNCLDLILEQGFSQGRWLIFLDAGIQSHIYGRLDVSVVESLKKFKPAVFSLRENFRNPRGIISEMCKLVKLPEPECRRELNSNVDYISFTDGKAQGKKLRALLVEILRDGILPAEISILSGVKRADACVTRFPPEIGKQIFYLEAGQTVSAENVITAASIPGFKGLENEVIILTDLPAFQNLEPWARSIFYVGMTRARSKLYALVNEAYLNDRFG